MRFLLAPSEASDYKELARQGNDKGTVVYKEKDILNWCLTKRKMVVRSLRVNRYVRSTSASVGTAASTFAERAVSRAFLANL